MPAENTAQQKNMNAHKTFPLNPLCYITEGGHSLLPWHCPNKRYTQEIEFLLLCPPHLSWWGTTPLALPGIITFLPRQLIPLSRVNYSISSLVNGGVMPLSLLKHLSIRQWSRLQEQAHEVALHIPGLQAPCTEQVKSNTVPWYLIREHTHYVQYFILQGPLQPTKCLFHIQQK